MKTQLDSVLKTFAALDSQQRLSILQGEPSVSIEARLALYRQVFNLANFSTSIIPLLLEVQGEFSEVPLLRLVEDFFKNISHPYNLPTNQNPDLSISPPLNLSYLASSITSYFRWNIMIFSPFYSLLSQRDSHPLSSMLSSLGNFLSFHISSIYISLKWELLRAPPYDFLELLVAICEAEGHKVSFVSGKFKIGQKSSTKSSPKLVSGLREALRADIRLIGEIFESNLGGSQESTFLEELEGIERFMGAKMGVLGGVLFEGREKEVGLELSKKFESVVEKLSTENPKVLLGLKGASLGILAEWLRSDREKEKEEMKKKLREAILDVIRELVREVERLAGGQAERFLDDFESAEKKKASSFHQFVFDFLRILQVKSALFEEKESELFGSTISSELGKVPDFSQKLCELIDDLLTKKNQEMSYLEPIELVKLIPNKLGFMSLYELTFMIRNLCRLEKRKLEEERQIGTALVTVCTEGEADKLLGLIHDLERVNPSSSHLFSAEELPTFQPIYSPHWQPLLNQLPLFGLEALEPSPQSPLAKAFHQASGTTALFLSARKRGELAIGLCLFEVEFANGMRLRAPQFVLALLEAIQTHPGLQPSQLPLLFAERGREIVPQALQAMLDSDLAIQSDKGVFIHPRLLIQIPKNASQSINLSTSDHLTIEVSLIRFLKPQTDPSQEASSDYDPKKLKARSVWLLKQKGTLGQTDLEGFIRQDYPEAGETAIRQALVDLLDDQVIMRAKEDPNLLQFN